MANKKKFRVTLSNAEFSYTVEVKADEKQTMEQFKELAIKKIKEKYKVDVPKDVEVDLEFEIIG
jgi:6-pyruvoyl-tetrahydropterin synthase